MKETRDPISETKHAKESEAENLKKKKILSAESSIFSTILADIEQNPTILQNQKNLSGKVSIFTTILDDFDELSPTVLQQQSKKKKTPIDFTRTVPQTLTRSDVIDKLNQELKILKSEMETKDQTSDRLVYRRECNCVEAKFLADEVLESIYEKDLEKSEIDSIDGKDFDEMLSTMLGDEDNNDQEHGIDEFLDEMFEKIEEDGSYLEKIKQDYVFGGLLENLFREKAEEEEKEISSWITNGEIQTETVTDIKKTKKKKSPVKARMDRIEQEPSLCSKRNCLEYRRRLYLMEKLREIDEKQRKKREKTVRFGVEFSLLMAEYMFLRPNEVLADETEEYWMCLKRLGVDKDDKGMNVIIRKLEELIEMVMRKRQNKEHYNVDLLLEPSFRFEDYIRLCADAIRVLGKIVWGLRKNRSSEKFEVSDSDSLFQDCQKVLMKLELKMAEMKQSVYRSVSADYESFSKSERFDGLLRRKVVKRVNADNRFGRAMIGSCLAEIWKSLFQAEALHVERKVA